MTLTRAIEHPTLTLVTLAEITAGFWARAWILSPGQTNTYEAALPLEVVSVAWNQTTALAQRASVADVEANPGSWFNDGAKLYVRPPAGESVFANTVQATVKFFLSTTAKVLGNRFYEPRLISAPNLSRRIEPVFGGVGQIGGGNMVLANADSYFDAWQNLQWDAGNVTLRIGADLPKQEMALADYVTVATWAIDNWKLDKEKFTLSLIEPKARLKTKLPLTFFDRETFPSIEQGNIGQPIPLAYGKVLGVKPICVDPGAKRFKVASHAVKSFDAIRMQTTTEEFHARTIGGAMWELYQPGVWRYYLGEEAARNVRRNGTSITQKNALDDVIAANNSWTSKENYVYVNPPSADADMGVATWIVESTLSVTSYQPINFLTVNPAVAEFTLSDVWATGRDLSVDFTGKVNGSGEAILDGPNIIADLLAIVGETNVDTASFTAATMKLCRGFDVRNQDVTTYAPTVWINESRQLLDVISDICALVGGYVFSDETGRFRMGIFSPLPSEALPEITDLDVLDFNEQSESKYNYSKVSARYAIREQDKFAQSVTKENAALQYVRAQTAPVLNEEDLALAEDGDAEAWATRQLLMLGAPLKQFTVTVAWNGLLRQPGGQVRVAYNRKAVNAAMEVLQVKTDVAANRVALTLGNLRNLSDTSGFWVADAPTLPTRFSALAGYGTGDASTWSKNWHPEIKAWARQNIGYWTDANGFADATDPDSFLCSAWI